MFGDGIVIYNNNFVYFYLMINKNVFEGELFVR